MMRGVRAEIRNLRALGRLTTVEPFVPSEKKSDQVSHEGVEITFTNVSIFLASGEPFKRASALKFLLGFHGLSEKDFYETIMSRDIGLAQDICFFFDTFYGFDVCELSACDFGFEKLFQRFQNL
jgi:hypothetical protein